MSFGVCLCKEIPRVLMLLGLHFYFYCFYWIHVSRRRRSVRIDVHILEGSIPGRRSLSIVLHSLRWRKDPNPCPLTGVPWIYTSSRLSLRRPVFSPEAHVLRPHEKALFLYNKNQATTIVYANLHQESVFGQLFVLCALGNAKR